MINHGYYVLKALKPIRYLTLLAAILAMTLSTLVVADLRVNRFFSFIMLASTLSTEDLGVDKTISENIERQIICNVASNEETFKTCTHGFRFHYHNER